MKEEMCWEKMQKKIRIDRIARLSVQKYVYIYKERNDLGLYCFLL